MYVTWLSLFAVLFLIIEFLLDNPDEIVFLLNESHKKNQ